MGKNNRMTVFYWPTYILDIQVDISLTPKYCWRTHPLLYGKAFSWCQGLFEQDSKPFILIIVQETFMSKSCTQHIWSVPWLIFSLTEFNCLEILSYLMMCVRLHQYCESMWAMSRLKFSPQTSTSHCRRDSLQILLCEGKVGSRLMLSVAVRKKMMTHLYDMHSAVSDLKNNRNDKNGSSLGFGLQYYNNYRLSIEMNLK